MALERVEGEEKRALNALAHSTAVTVSLAGGKKERCEAFASFARARFFAHPTLQTLSLSARSPFSFSQLHKYAVWLRPSKQNFFYYRDLFRGSCNVVAMRFSNFKHTLCTKMG